MTERKHAKESGATKRAGDKISRDVYRDDLRKTGAVMPELAPRTIHHRLPGDGGRWLA